jgi:hypothetical protein
VVRRLVGGLTHDQLVLNWGQATERGLASMAVVGASIQVRSGLGVPALAVGGLFRSGKKDPKAAALSPAELTWLIEPTMGVGLMSAGVCGCEIAMLGRCARGRPRRSDLPRRAAGDS